MAFITAETRSDLIELSVAMLKQAPSAALLEELIALSVGGGSLADAADHIAKTDAFKAEYPSFQTAEQYAAEIFDNITTGGTVTADIRTAVIELATGMLTSGSVTKAGLALAIAEYLAAPAALLNTDFADIAQSFQNRADAAEYFVVTKELGGSTDAELAAAIASVTSDAATLTAANTAADATASAEAVVAGQTFTLTTNTDSVTGLAGNDSIISSSTTFQSDDIINGGAGTDSLSIAASGAGTVIGNLTAVETVKVTNGGANGTDFGINMITASGVTEVNSRLSTGEVSFDALQEIATVSAFGTQAGSKTTATFNNALASGTADSISLRADGGADVDFQVSGVDATKEFETINLTSAGSSKNTVAIADGGGTAPASLKTLNVDGAGPLTMTLTGGVSTGASFSAASATGVQTITWGGNFTSITGGSAADSITATGAFLGSTAAKTIDGGDGIDTLYLSGDIANLTAASSGTHTISNIEAVVHAETLLEASNADQTATVAIDKLGQSVVVAAITNLDTDSTDALTTTFSGVSDEAISFLGSHDSQGFSNFTVTLKSSTGLSDSLTLTAANPASASAVNKISTLDVSTGIEAFTLNLDANDLYNANGTLASTGTVIAALDAGGAATVTLAGTGGVTLTAVEIADPAGTTTAAIDASGMSGVLILGATGADFKSTDADTITVTTGSGTNILNFGAAMLSSDKVIGTGTDTVNILESASGTLQPTLTDVEKVVITPSATASDAETISAKNFTNVGTIQVVSAANTGNEGLIFSNLGAGQAVDLKSAAGLFEGDTIVLGNATGVSGNTVSLSGGAAMHSGGVALTTSGGALSLTDNNKVAATGLYFDGTVTVAAASALAPQSSVVLSGGGMKSSVALATVTLAGTTNVNLASIDATGLASNLDISGVTTKAGASITLGTGSNTVTLAQADLARDAIALNGGDGTDTAVITLADATADVDLRPGLNSVEKLTITQSSTTNASFDYNLSLADTDAVATITLDPNGSDDNLVIDGASGEVVLSLADDYSAATVGVSVNGATGLTVNNSAAIGGDIDITAANATTVTVALKNSSAISVDALTVASATTVNLGGNNTTSVGAAYAGDITVASLVAAKGTTLNIDTNQGNVAIPTLTAAKLTALNIVGDGSFTAGATAATTTALASLDGSTATGAITVTQNMDFASGATIKTGFNSDSVTLDVLTEGNVAVDMGEFTGTSDTLLIAGANNMGLTVVDLSAADQISQLNGAINGAVQTGIENITLSGLTGSFGATVTGSADANTIIGTGNADNIIAGEAADTITGGAGIDTIDLSEATAKTDTVVIASALTANRDVITGFGTADIIDLDESAFASINFGGTAADAALDATDYNEVAAGGTILADHVNVITTAAGYASYTAAIAAVTAAANSAEAFVVFYNNVSGQTELYWDADADDGDSGVLIAQLDITGANLAATLSEANFSVF